MRLFDLTISVHGPDDYLPVTFEDWLRLAFGDEAVDQIGANPTTLVSVVERRYPLSDDIVERRRGGMGPVYG